MFYTSLLKFGISKEDVMAYSRHFNVPDDEQRFPLHTIFKPTWCFCYSFFVECSKERKAFARIDKLVETEEFQNVLRDTFLSYIKRHQQLMTYMEDVDDFFSYYFIVKLPMYMLYIILILYLWILVSEAFAVNKKTGSFMFRGGTDPRLKHRLHTFLAQ